MELTEQLAVAKAFTNLFLKELCLEQTQLDDGEKLVPDLPHIQRLRELCAYAGSSADRMASSLIASAAMRYIANWK